MTGLLQRASIHRRDPLYKQRLSSMLVTKLKSIGVRRARLYNARFVVGFGCICLFIKNDMVAEGERIMNDPVFHACHIVIENVDYRLSLAEVHRFEYITKMLSKDIIPSQLRHYDSRLQSGWARQAKLELRGNLLE